MTTPLNGNRPARPQASAAPAQPDASSNAPRPALRTAVVLAGGFGTRFLPFTKAVPKEMLPIGSKPAIHHVIEECLPLGVEEIIIVTRANCSIIPRYFGGIDVHLRRHLEDCGRQDLLGQLDMESRLGPKLTFVREEPAGRYGNARPIVQLKERLAAEPLFAVLFADDVILGRSGIAQVHEALVHARAEAAVAMKRVPAEQLCRFGNLAVSPLNAYGNGGLCRVHRIVQRPTPGEVCSPYALVSRIVTSPAVFDYMNQSDRHRELDLGISLSRMASEKLIVGADLAGHWVTTGDPESYLEANRCYHHLAALGGNG